MLTSSELQFGALREVAARERQGALSRRVRQRSIGWVRTRFGEGGGQFNHRRARRMLNRCARESKARTGRFLREKLISDHGLFSSYEGRSRSGERARIMAPASPAQGLHHHEPRYFKFPYSCMMCGLEKHRLVDQT